MSSEISTESSTDKSTNDGTTDGFEVYASYNGRRNQRRNKRKNKLVFKEKTVDDYLELLNAYKDELMSSDLVTECFLNSQLLNLTKGSYDQLICLALGSPIGTEHQGLAIPARYQLAMVLVLSQYAQIPLQKVFIWDPEFQESDFELFKRLGVNAVEIATSAASPVHADNTLYYLPHCPATVLNDLIDLCENQQGSCILGNDIYAYEERLYRGDIAKQENLTHVIRAQSWLTDEILDKYSRGKPYDSCVTSMSIQKPRKQK